MCAFIPKPFCPPFWLTNAHVQTLLPRLMPMPTVRYQRQLHMDSTGTAVVAYDFIATDAKKPLYVLFHGLEGSSQSPYAKAFALYARAFGHNFVVIHYRGCGGIKNTAQVDYNGGDTQEIDHVLSRLCRVYPHLYVIGVSLGGNMLAKYLGEYDNTPIKAAAVISAPLDLPSSALMLQKTVAKRIYVPYLLSSLRKKARFVLDDATLKTIKDLSDFDDVYTAPRHGYASALDYYKKASALPYLCTIDRPTLIVNSQDDPFLGKEVYQRHVSDKVVLYKPAHGGHVGFVDVRDGKLSMDYLPALVFEFFAQAE